MSRPRQIFREQFYLLTRSCTQRQFLLRPDETTNNAFIYCLAEAAKRFKIDILLTTAESNHHHTVCYDRYGRFPQFVEHFHKLLARCMNARWGRSENLWASEEPCLTRLLDRDTVIKELVYAAANPVKDLLVQRAVQWPGANGYRHLIFNQPMRARRPHHFFREGGVMPEEVTLELVIPAVLGPREQVIEEVKRGVEAVELAMQQHCQKTGRRILGRARVLRQSWTASSTSERPPRTLRPRFAGRVDVRIPALLAYRTFLADHAAARRAWLATGSALFPPGTYWLARFTPASVIVEPSPH
jgi:putative transposase